MKQSNSKANRLRVTLWIAGIVVAAALVYFAGMNLMMARMNSNLPSELDYSTMHNSNNDLYRVSYHASTDSVPVNQMHQWTLHVETLDGQPVENAAITVDGDMPQHGHGLPTRPQVTQYLGNGDYLVEGVKFQMGGWWVMDFTITAAGQTDVVRFNMVLP